MKKIMTVLASLMIVATPMAAAFGEVLWENEFTEFAFAVDKNRGIFINAPNQYLETNQAEESKIYMPSQSEKDPYNSIASGSFTEFIGLDGEVVMSAMAMATGELTSPDKGLEVQAYARTIPTALDADYGIDVDQTVISWVSRYFKVSENGTYEVRANLQGLTDFDDFYTNQYFFATYSITAEISIHEMVINDSGEIDSFVEVLSIPVALETPLQQLIDLTTTNDSGYEITYQLKISLLLESEVVNFLLDADPIPEGTVSGTFDLGTNENPMVLTASVDEPMVEYYLTTSAPDGNGTLVPESGIYAENTVVDLQATPNTGYVVDTWSGTDNDSSTALTNTVTMTEDKTVTVTFKQAELSLAASVSEGEGSITPTSGEYTYGTVVDLVATPAEGYQLASWTGTDDDSSTALTNTVTMTEDRMVTVSFELIPRELTASVSGGNGSITPTSGTYGHGTVVTLTATPDEGYRVAAWSGTDNDSSTDLTNTVTMTEDKTVTVSFELIPYMLAASVSAGNGSITPTSGTYDFGTVVTLTATPNKGYQVASWSGTDNDSSTATTNTVTMTSDKIVTVSFKLIRYTLTAGVSGGNGTISPTSGTYDYGTIVNLIATPVSEDYEVAYWSGTDDDNSTAQNNTVTMTSDKTVRVVFQEIDVPHYQLTTSVASGQGALSPQGGSYAAGLVVTLTATPNEGYRVASWSGTDDDNSTAATNTVTMNADKAVTVSFVLEEYTLSASVAEGEGAIAPTAGTYTYGTVVDITATPGSGYKVAAWSGTDNDDSTAQTNTVTMTSDKTVMVYFEPATYILSVTTDPEAGGSVSRDPDQDEYSSNTEVTLTADAYPNFVFSGWEGEVSDPDAVSTTIVMNADQNVTAIFLSDADGDGTADIYEQGPDPENPQPDFDGNNDGIPDAQQANVVSLFGPNDGYVTLSCDTPGVAIQDVQSMAAPDDVPEDWEFPLGCYAFRIIVPNAGDAVTLIIDIHTDIFPESYFKKGPTPGDASDHWYEFISDGTTGALINGKRIELLFVDGQRGDDDLAANAEIVDQGGPVTPVAGPAAGDDTTGSGGDGGSGCFLHSAMH